MRKLIYLVLFGFALTLFSSDAHALNWAKLIQALVDSLSSSKPGKHAPDLAPTSPAIKPPPSATGLDPPIADGLDDPLSSANPHTGKAEDSKGEYVVDALEAAIDLGKTIAECADRDSSKAWYDTTITVTVDDVLIRDCAGAGDCKVIGELAKGKHELTVWGIKGCWVMIQYELENGSYRVGFVDSKYIKTTSIEVLDVGAEPQGITTGEIHQIRKQYFDLATPPEFCFPGEPGCE